MKMDPSSTNVGVKLVKDFVNNINAKKTEKFSFQLNKNHSLIDAHGNKVIGLSEVINAWKKYFEIFPNYRIDIDIYMAKDFQIGAFGYASGSYLGMAERFWRIPAAWLIELEADKIKKWQVYADTQIPLNAMIL